MKKLILILIGVAVIALAVLVFRFSSPKDTWINEKENLIRVSSPAPNQKVKSPLVVKGEARGVWFFEASFPVFLVDWDGRIIAQGIATAKDDWMTENFVPFEATLDFVLDKNAYSNRGALILKKDNPSGLPEYDDALEMPVIIGE